MKRIWFGVLLFIGPVVRAQTFAEWFQQTKTEKRYYLQQIAALQTYALEAEEGYGILKKGLNTIQEIDSGEMGLHRGFYESLVKVNPAIGNMGEVKEIVNVEEAIIDRISSARKRYRENSGLAAGELDYIGKVFASTPDAGLEDVDFLLDIATPGKLKMSDDERMGVIDRLDKAMKGRYVFIADFIGRVDLLCLQRKMSGVSAGTVKGIYGLP